MVFWTILFFAISFYGLFKGSIFAPTAKKMIEINMGLAEGEDKDKLGAEFIKNGCLPLIFACSVLFAEIIYLIIALQVDTLKYPTIVAIIVLIFGFIFLKSKKKYSDMNAKELEIEKAKLITYKSITLKSFVKSLLWSTYFGYMFYVLVF
jgi:hypothetical protein